MKLNDNMVVFSGLTVENLGNKIIKFTITDERGAELSAETELRIVD